MTDTAHTAAYEALQSARERTDGTMVTFAFEALHELVAAAVEEAEQRGRRAGLEAAVRLLDVVQSGLAAPEHGISFHTMAVVRGLIVRELSLVGTVTATTGGEEEAGK